MRCPDGKLVAAWVDGECDVSVAAHVDGCERCTRLAREHRQVKRRTAGLSALPAPEPGSDLVSSLLTVPVAEHTRQRQARCAPVAASRSRPAGLAVGALAGVGLVAVAWMAPLGAGPVGTGAAGPAAPTRPPASTPASTPPSPLVLSRWSPTDD